MKKTIFMIMFLLITACNNQGQQSEDDKRESEKEIDHQEEITNEVDEQLVIEEFKTWMQQVSDESEIITFIDQHHVEAKQKEIEEMLLTLENYQEEQLPSLTDTFFEGSIQQRLIDQFDYRFTQNKIDDITDDELKEYLKLIYQQGYQLRLEEGQYYPIINYDFFKKYTSRGTEAIKDYIEIMAAESNQPSYSDAHPAISIDEFFIRAMNTENFFKNYSNFKHSDKIKELYLKYVSSYVNGGCCLGGFDFQNRIDEKVIQEFERASRYNAEQSDFIQLVKNYVEVLSHNKYKRNIDVDEHKTFLIHKLRGQLFPVFQPKAQAIAISTISQYFSNDLKENSYQVSVNDLNYGSQHFYDYYFQSTTNRFQIRLDAKQLVPTFAKQVPSGPPLEKPLSKKEAETLSKMFAENTFGHEKEPFSLIDEYKENKFNDEYYVFYFKNESNKSIYVKIHALTGVISEVIIY